MGIAGVLVKREPTNKPDSLYGYEFGFIEILTFVDHVSQVSHIFQLVLLWRIVRFVAGKRQTLCAKPLLDLRMLSEESASRNVSFIP